MNIYAQIVKNYYSFDSGTPTASDTPGAATVDGTWSGEVYICIYDAGTRQAANGNNVIVSYQEIINGISGPVKQRSVPGQSVLIYSGVLQTGGDTPYTYDAMVTGLKPYSGSDIPYTDGSGSPTAGTPPATCDAAISSVTINRPESDYGAANGSITINAGSSYLPLQYSLNGSDWQNAATFTRLTGGGYTAYIRDANGCTASLSFTLPASRRVLTGEPSVDLGNGNISRWNAAFNPIVFTYQRKDAELLKIEPYSAAECRLTLNADMTSALTGDYLYLNAGPLSGAYQVSQSVTVYNEVVIALTYQPGMAGLTGFVNSNRLRPYYKIITQITYQDPALGQQTLLSTNRPDVTGLVQADLSSFLQTLLRPQDASDFTSINYRDDNLSASYTLSYAEVWDGNNDNGQTRVYLPVSTPFYVVYAAKQLGDAYGGNLAAYVPFKAVANPAQLARWITDFNEPAYSEGYPFDISFIYSEDLAGLPLQCEIVQLDINRQPLPGGPQTTYLLNEDGSFLYNTDGSRLIISRAAAGNVMLAQHIGLNRLLISGGFAPQAAYFTLTLKYTDDSGDHAVTQTQVLRIDDAVDDQSVYLRWIGLSGSWNYYRFVYNQEISLDVQNAVIIKRFVSDWQRQEGIEEVLSKSAGQKMKVMAEDLSVNDIKGLQSLKYSPKVQLLTGRSPVTWQTVVLNTATFDEYETRYGQAPFSVTFNMPSVNIQTQ